MRRPVRSNERGAVLLTVAAGILMLVGIAAYVVDLSAIRLDRAADQRITDAAASAGALATFEGSAVEGCESALAYVAINTDGLASLPTTGCGGTYGGSCGATERELTVSSGRWQITLVNPVPDGHDLMEAGQIGASGLTATSADDGDPCDRFGVQMAATHTSNFAQAIGSSQGSTTVHSVARAELPGLNEPPINLLVLDRTGCDGILVEGKGGVVVTAVTDPATGDIHPGLAAADSDASNCASGGVIRIEGSNAELRADGPPGCPDDLTPPVGHGCGLLQVLAPGTPGCNAPACVPGAGGSNPPVPEPTALPDRMTRKQVDYRYNCWSDYTSPPGAALWATDPLTAGNEQNIPPCPHPSAPHIYDLIGVVGATGNSGHSVWPHGCNIPASANESISGDVVVDCASFVVEGDVRIDGNVIFNGNVHVKSHGILEIHNSPGWAVFRDGHLRKDGQASLIFDETMVYMSKSSWVEIAGGSTGTLSWRAPQSGNFEDLALWSDSPTTHTWAGQGLLVMRGAFFTPFATGEYSGSSGQNQTDAQWVADKLRARGQGDLAIQPEFDFPVKRADTPRSVLIR